MVVFFGHDFLMIRCYHLLNHFAYTINTLQSLPTIWILGYIREEGLGELYLIFKSPTRFSSIFSAARSQGLHWCTLNAQKKQKGAELQSSQCNETWRTTDFPQFARNCRFSQYWWLMGNTCLFTYCNKASVCNGPFWLASAFPNRQIGIQAMSQQNIVYLSTTATSNTWAF